MGTTKTLKLLATPLRRLTVGSGPWCFLWRHHRSSSHPCNMYNQVFADLELTGKRRSSPSLQKIPDTLHCNALRIKPSSDQANIRVCRLGCYQLCPLQLVFFKLNMSCMAACFPRLGQKVGRARMEGGCSTRPFDTCLPDLRASGE